MGTKTKKGLYLSYAFLALSNSELEHLFLESIDVLNLSREDFKNWCKKALEAMIPAVGFQSRDGFYSFRDSHPFVKAFL